MFALAFLQASIASLLAGACTWLLLRGVARTWPALEARRAPWLLGIAAVAGTLALGLLPGAARLSIVPAIELPAVLANATLADGTGRNALQAGATNGDGSGAIAGEDAAFDGHGATPIEPAPALLWLGYFWLALYGSGLLLAAARWLQARRRLCALLAASQRLDRFELAAHPGFASLHRQLPEVREIEAPIAPMLVGLRRPVLLLPRHLRDFDPVQQRLVVEHELTHLARRDPLWMHASFLLQAIQWFNPMVARLSQRMAWAQELGCDRTVLQDRPATQRRAYASALLAQMRMQAMPGHGAALAFGGRVVDTVAARIGMIRDGVPALPRAVAGALAWAALPSLLAASVLLQPALAWRVDAVAAAAPAGLAAASPAAPHAGALPGEDQTRDGLPHWQAPMERLRVSAFFGILHALTGRLHGGMDFAARIGTPIVAPADGIVVASTSNYMGEAKWGELVAIEHANGLRSLYAHMDKRLVQEGERVAAGQQIGTSGASGKVTGPHLHMEVSRNGRNMDPQSLLGNLEADATRTALQRLKASRAS
ncbi:peptidoglycan DD-metalloendopeptidase family protein [Pseudoduganella sp. HUAS MS19]